MPGAMRVLSALLVVSALPLPAEGDVSLPACLSDGMVVQRGVPVPIFGKAPAGEKVEVRFRGGGVSAVSDGKWKVHLPAQKPGGPFTMTVRGANTIELKDVYVGDVWVASGQSNMVSLGQFKPDPSVAGRVRMFTGLRPTGRVKGGQWLTEGTFSRIGWFFANELLAAEKVPQGVLFAAQGGTPVAPWIAPTDDDPKGGVLFNRWVRPLTPVPVRGVIWWQGEWDAKRGQAKNYHEPFVQLIRSWRKAWGDDRLAFLWIQLQRFKGPMKKIPEGWQMVREGQRKALALPHTAMAVSFDLTAGDNHPPEDEKRLIAGRLALAARGVACGAKIEYSGPLYASAEVKEGNIVVRFTHAKGLAARGGELGELELRSGDGEFSPVQAAVVGETILVPTGGKTGPFTVRYAWRKYPKGNLYNAAGLPGSPFVTEAIPAAGKPRKERDK